jgi:hypothetical protein
MMHPSAMRRPFRRRILRSVAIVIVGAVLVAGCGESEVQPPAIHDLSEPWQPVPFQLDQAVYGQIEAACRGSGMAPGAALAVIDARGDNTAVAVFAGKDVRAECLVVREAGRLSVPSSGETRGDGAIEQVAPRAISNVSVGMGSQLTPQGTNRDVVYVTGQAGNDVGSIELVVGEGLRVRVSLWNTGWFAAWWLGEESSIRYDVYDTSGVLVTPP